MLMEYEWHRLNNNETLLSPIIIKSMTSGDIILKVFGREVVKSVD